MIPFDLTSLAQLRTLDVDAVIDVRAPSEFAEDHLPGAINLPVLDDAQRAEVGTIYKQQSPFDARKIGAALVAQNTATHLQTALSGCDGAWQPLIYCWRGGQRSGAFATILDQVGWRVRLLKGGYRSYRRHVAAMLYDTALSHRLVIIDGGTGTGKTALLQALAKAGAQTLDLEGLAGHRGSLFGELGAPQPSQKLFESRLAMALTACDPHVPTFVEAESSKVGDRLVPPTLWARMAAAPRVRLSVPLAARSAFLCRAYADLTEDAEVLANVIEKLRPYHAAEQIDAWQTAARKGDWRGLAEGLIATHYDPRYAKSADRKAAPVATLDLADLEEVTLARTAADLMARFQTDEADRRPAKADR